MRTLVKSAVTAAALLLSVVISASSASAGGGSIVTVVPPIEGYVWGWQPANPNYISATGYEYNSAGGAVQIIRSAVGTYQVRFVGMAGTGGAAHVGAYGNNFICAVSSWGPSLGDEVVNLRCFTSAGVPADSRFIAHVTNRTDGAARGYLWSNDPTPPAGGYTPSALYSYDSTGQPITVFPTGVGSYAVDLGAFGQDNAGLWMSGTLRVTAYGPSPAHCQVLDPAVFVDPEILRVRCYGPTGLAVNTRFVLSYTRGVVPVSATVDNYVNPPVVAGWTSSGGVAPSVSELGVGDYLITFPAAGTPGGHAFASIMGTPPMYCVIQSWTVNGGATKLRVRCFDPGGGAPNPGVLVNAGFFV
ncbi:MAG TPA: hypothetical protein VHM94_12880 [Acidimicrobiia bacterium]|nr:hypothetical protein [Acidimicrobiia bacterium]